MKNTFFRCLACIFIFVIVINEALYAQNTVWGEAAEAKLAEQVDHSYHLTDLEEEVFQVAKALDRFDLHGLEALNSWSADSVWDAERRQVVLLPIMLDSVDFINHYPQAFALAANHGFSEVMGVHVKEIVAVPVEDKRSGNQVVYSGFEGKIIYEVSFFNPKDKSLTYQIVIGENNVGNSSIGKIGVGVAKWAGRLTGDRNLVEGGQAMDESLNLFQADTKKGALENAVRQSGKDLRSFLEENFILELPVLSCSESEAYKYQITIKGGERFGLQSEQKVDVMDPGAEEDNSLATVVIKSVEGEVSVAKCGKKEYKVIQEYLDSGRQLMVVVGKEKKTLMGKLPFGKKNN